MSNIEPPPATGTGTASATPTPTPGSPAPTTTLSPITYVVIPLVTLASVFLIGLCAHLRRRHSMRAEERGGVADGGEAQMQERRRDNTDTADRWPSASLGFNWWFLRSNEGLNELGEAPPPYDINKRRKAATEGSASATDEGSRRGSSVLEEVAEEDEDRETRHSGESIRESVRHSGEQSVISSHGDARRSTEEPRRSADRQRRRSGESIRTMAQGEQIHHLTQLTEEEEPEDPEQTHAYGEAPPRRPAHDPRTPPPDTDTEPPLLSAGAHRRQTPEEIHAIVEARRRHNQRRREQRESAAAATSPSDVCSTEFFRAASPGRDRRRIERLNRRLRRLGYSTSDISTTAAADSYHHGFQLRDMEDGAAPPDYERDPAVAVPPPAQLPPPLAADAPPPYPVAPAARRHHHRAAAADDGGPPMVRQAPRHHEHLAHHNYLFMPPLEHDYLVTSFSASLDMPRHLHSRF